MAPTPITASSRYFAPGTTKVYFFPACANKAAPTRAELDAGKDLTPEISTINGWTVTSNLIDVPDYGTTFTGKIPGRTAAADSSINCYASSNTIDVKAVLPRNTTGFVGIMWAGDVPTQKCDVFPIRVASAGRQVPDNAASDVVVQFAITGAPAEDVAIP